MSSGDSPTPNADALLDGLNPPQQEAVMHGEGPLLIFAGAGSGKTRVLTARIAYLIATHRVWPDRLLAVTFTNKAAKEMRARVENLVGEGAEKMWVGTFHSTAVKILRREAQRIGITNSFVIFDEDDTRAALRRVLDELRLDPKRYPIGALSNAISQAKNELKGPNDYPNRSYADEVVRRVYESYQEVLRRSGGLDFDDLIMKLVELFNTDEAALATGRWTNTRTRTARSTCWSTSLPRSIATWSWSVTTTSRSTASAAQTSGTSSTSGRTTRTPT